MKIRFRRGTYANLPSLDDGEPGWCTDEKALYVGQDGTAEPCITLSALSLPQELTTLSVPSSATISAFGKTLIDDADASAFLTTLGLDTDLLTLSIPASATISTFMKTLLDDTDAATARGTLEISSSDDSTFNSVTVTTTLSALTVSTSALTAAGLISANGAIIVNGTTTTGIGRSDAQIEIQNNGSGHAMFSSILEQNPGNTTNENAWSMQGYDASGNMKQIGAFYSRWQDTTALNGFSVCGIHPNYSSSGADTADVCFEVFGAHGIGMFLGAAATPPTDRYLLIKRTTAKPSICGVADLVLDATISASAASTVHIQAYNPGNAVLVEGGGNVGINKASPGYLIDCEASGGGYYSASDHAWHDGSSIRWKENVKLLRNGLSYVSALRPVKFDWKETHGGKKGNIGFIAEEVNKVLPEIVSMSPTDEGYADGMDYAKLTAVLVAAVQELSNKVVTLEKKLNARQ